MARLASAGFPICIAWGRGKGTQEDGMSESIGIIITGASGRMGRMLIETVEANPGTHLVGVTERVGHTWIGQDLGAAMGRGEMGVPVVDDLLEILPKAKAIIDFTSPEATVAHSVLAAQARAWGGTTAAAAVRAACRPPPALGRQDGRRQVRCYHIISKPNPSCHFP